MDGRGSVLYGNKGGVWVGGAQYPTEMREGCSTYGNEGGVWMGGAQYSMEMRKGCGWEGCSTLWK